MTTYPAIREALELILDREYDIPVVEALNELNAAEKRASELEILLANSCSLSLYDFVERDATRYRDALEMLRTGEVHPSMITTEWLNSRTRMSSSPGYTLEEYLEWYFGYLTPELLQKHEQYRVAVEYWLMCFNEETQSWRGYASGCPIP